MVVRARILKCEIVRPLIVEQGLVGGFRSKIICLPAQVQSICVARLNLQNQFEAIFSMCLLVHANVAAGKE